MTEIHQEGHLIDLCILKRPILNDFLVCQKIQSMKSSLPLKISTSQQFKTHSLLVQIFK